MSRLRAQHGDHASGGSHGSRTASRRRHERVAQAREDHHGHDERRASLPVRHGLKGSERRRCKRVARQAYLSHVYMHMHYTAALAHEVASETRRHAPIGRVLYHKAKPLLHAPSIITVQKHSTPFRIHIVRIHATKHPASRNSTTSPCPGQHPLRIRSLFFTIGFGPASEFPDPL